MAITVNEIPVPKKFPISHTEKELEFDFPLPEFCPDIARIVRVDCTPFFDLCEVGDGKAIVSGRAVFDILYETDYKNRLRCCTFSKEFSQSVPLPRDIGEDASAFCTLECEKIGCKLLSARRLIAKATVGADFRLEGLTNVRTVAVDAGDGAFFKKKRVEFDGKTESFSGKYDIKETFSLNQSEKNIGEVVCGNVTLGDTVVSVGNGIAELKTTAVLHALCEDENSEGSYFVSQKTLPISVEMKNDFSDGDAVRTKMSAESLEILPELDQYGESRQLKTAFSLKVSLERAHSEAVDVAEDYFETDFDSIPIFASATLPKTVSQSDHGFTAEEKVAPMSPKPDTLLDASARSLGSTVQSVDGGINLSGSFVVTILAQTAEGVRSFDHAIPYERFFALETSGLQTVSAIVSPTEASASLHSDGSATLRVMATAKLTVSEESDESFVSDVTKRTPIATNPSDDLVFCFPKEGESLWEIAKSYRVDPEKVLESNRDAFDSERETVAVGKPIRVNG